MPSTIKYRSNKLSTKQERAEVLVNNPIMIRRELNNRSLFNFIEFFWDVVSNDQFKPNWHIDVLCKELEVIAERVAKREKKEYDLIINIPPGMTKTIICSIMYPVWVWSKWFDIRFITASYSSTLSLESAEYSRDLIRSEKFQALYPELNIKGDKDKKGNFKITKTFEDKKGNLHVKNGGNRFSTSVGGTLTGFHGHINIVDDGLNPTEAKSDTELEAANHWCDQTLSSRKADKNATTQITIMQRLHQNDPSGHMLAKKKKKIKHICLPAEIRNYKKYVKPQELIKYYKNDLLDPVRLDWDALEEAEADMGQYGYAGQMGQNPVPPGGGMFKVDHLQMLTEVPNKNNIVSLLRYWDKAATKDGGKRSAGVKLGLLKNGKWVILDVKKGQWGTDERERIIKETAFADGVSVKIWMEQEPGSGGKESAESSIANLAGFSVQAENPSGEKAVRADPFSVQVNKGNVYLVPAPWNYEFIEELRYFPFSTFKDQVDAAAGAFNKLALRRQARAAKRRRGN
jgi:predicted phage terminase large subunit-like protein